MLCIKCGATLNDIEYCSACGTDIKIYKRLIRLSNTYYNTGLEKARVRNLTGAVQDLRSSLKLNKENIQARNLLGLVYFETGEVVAALTEWIISKNLEPNKNIADEYIRAIQNNPARLETINQTIKKYNQSLLYCQQGSEDLAVIQLKKVLSLNPRLVKAHQLLALLYIQSEEYERAARELRRALAIDCTDNMSLRYLEELGELTKIQDYIKALATYGTAAGEPYIRHLSGDIWELRPLRDRVLFAAWADSGFVLLHHFMKTTQKTPRREIMRARKELADFKERSSRL